MVKVIFKYKDEYTRGNWKIQSGTYENVDQCISMNGLKDCESEIISVEEINE